MAGPDDRLLLLTPESLDFSLSAPPLLPPVTPTPPTTTMPPPPSLPPPPNRPPFLAIIRSFDLLLTLNRSASLSYGLGQLSTSAIALQIGNIVVRSSADKEL
uniref:Uncharacterized protein n=1 Tax=Anopheles culicifacies TaxID=139723 RepID=A0A182MDG9_9DIPT